MSHDTQLPEMSGCPFCGDCRPELAKNPVTNLHYVACTKGTDCDARGPSSPVEAEAIDGWNATVPRTGPLPFTHWTCGTAHIRAERTLQIIREVAVSDPDAMEMIAGLVNEAGYENAIRATQDEVPF